MNSVTQYAKSGDIRIAYQVHGKGPVDLVVVLGYLSHLEHFWEEPRVAAFYRRLMSFARLILFDKRGSGLSDPLGEAPTLEQRMEDIRAVMDAVGSERAAVLGLSEGGTLSALFAATHPQRTLALVLLGSFPRFTWAEDYPSGFTPEQMNDFWALIDQTWGQGTSAQLIAPNLAADKRFIDWFGKAERYSASPGRMKEILRAASEIDIRHVLPAIRVPTLVIHRAADSFVSVGHGRYLAAHIPDAQYFEPPGTDHLFCLGDTTPILSRIEEFVTGSTHSPDLERVLATLLCTDIVESTTMAQELGDREWRDRLAAHHELVRRELTRFGGHELDTAGDGFLASFDGPARAVRCACAIREAVKKLGLTIRAGLHTGECEVIDQKLAGIAVHICARITALASANQIVVSSTVKDLVAGSGLAFDDNASHKLKGISGEWKLFAVRG